MPARKIDNKIKEKRGTLNKNRKGHIADTPEPEVYTFVIPHPEELDEWGRKIWDELVPQLVSLGIFTNIDKKLFFTYCNEMGLYEMATSKLREDGFVEYTGDKGYPIPSPWVGIKNRAFANAIKVSTEFGLSPASRTRISVGASKPVGKRALIKAKVESKK